MIDYKADIYKVISDTCDECNIKFDKSDYQIDVSEEYSHNSRSLPLGMRAVFLFITADEKCLGVYRANKNSNAAFQSHPYGINRSAGNLSKSLYGDPNSPQYHNENVGEWIKANTKRIDIIYNGEYSDYFSQYLKYKLQEEFKPIYKAKVKI